MRRANEQRFSERLGNQYEQYRQQRLANSESECRKMIADITTRLTQAGISITRNTGIASGSSLYFLRHQAAHVQLSEHQQLCKGFLQYVVVMCGSARSF